MKQGLKTKGMRMKQRMCRGEGQEIKELEEKEIEKSYRRNRILSNNKKNKKFLRLC